MRRWVSRKRSGNFILAVALCTLTFYPSSGHSDIHAAGEVIGNVFTLIDGVTGLPITGETPTAAIVRLVDGYYLDWNDDTFKASGWTQQYANMTEIGTSGSYRVTLDSTGYNGGGYSALFKNTGDNAGSGSAYFTISNLLSPNLGTGQVSVNHDYPTPDNMTVEDEYGAGIDNVYVRIYTKTDYDAARLGEGYIKAMTMTDVDGEWEDYCWLTPATYTAVFMKSGLQTQTKEFTVTSP